MSKLQCKFNVFTITCYFYSFYILQIEPSVMYDLLVSGYKMFRMFVGQLKDIPPEEIYDKCEQFFTPVSLVPIYYKYFYNTKL